MTEHPSTPSGRVVIATALMALICAAALSLPMPAGAAPLAAGSAMPTLILNDQHDRPASVGTQTRWVVFAAEKPVSDMVSAVLAAEPAGVAEDLRLLLGLPAKPTTP